MSDKDYAAKDGLPQWNTNDRAEPLMALPQYTK
jgi:hypothetical protein